MCSSCARTSVHARTHGRTAAHQHPHTHIPATAVTTADATATTSHTLLSERRGDHAGDSELSFFLNALFLTQRNQMIK
jgi:hypothetical protein